MRLYDFSIILSYKTKQVSITIPLKRMYSFIHKVLTAGIKTTAKAVGVTALTIFLLCSFKIYTTIKSGIDDFNYKKNIAELEYKRLVLEAYANDLQIPDNIKDPNNFRTTIELNKFNKNKEEFKNVINRDRFFKDLVMSHTPSVNPLPNGHIVSGFNYRISPISNLLEFHEGLDIISSDLAPVPMYITAPADGIVERAGPYGGYGNVVIIDHQMGIKTRYGHCSYVVVVEGQHIHRGQIIAMTGATGNATGIHLHYEVYYNKIRMNPKYFIQPDYSL